MLKISDPAHWTRLKTILADAMEEPSAQRRMETLRQACAKDAQLLQEAERLLNQDTTSLENFAEFATTHLRDDQPSRVGERLGAYVMTGEIGRGGMGAVYLGRRADGQFEKQVAIKILKRGTDTDEVLRRFRVERQILANLEGAHVTRLLDAGITGDNLPYVVMEYVDGRSITTFVKDEGCDLRARLDLFLNVCSAVDLAHRQGVIHRDLKPSNILIKRDREVKLLDFGIAKVLAATADDVTMAIERRLTPKYAAPEQSTTELPTVATDIYSLGIVLSELLNISPQLALPDKDHLSGCLHEVVKRATQVEPTGRFQSASALAEAIQACLNNPFRPGDARRSTIQAHPFLALAAGIVLLAILASAFLWPRWTRLASRNHFNSARTTTQPASDRVRSIAVLPFNSLSQDQDKLLGLGMADAIIGRLSGLKELMVLPTAAVSRFATPVEDVLAAGKNLNVDAVLSGTVQQAQGRIRVTVQLINVGSRRTLWADTFDQTSTDIFTIQDSISERVARSLLANLSETERQQLEKHYTCDTAAYESYLLGVSAYNLRTKEGLQKAIEYFQQAITSDPHYALAYALMSDSYYLQTYYKYEPSEPAMTRARSAAERALALDSSLPEAHLAMSTIQRCEPMTSPGSANSPGIASLLRAMHLNPNYALAHLRYAWFLCATGQLDAAVQEMRKAQALDPLSSTTNTALGITLLFANKADEAVQFCERAAELNPDEPFIQGNLGCAYLLANRYDDAIARFRNVEKINPAMQGDAVTQIATVLVRAGRRNEADKAMPEILELAKQNKVLPYNMLLLHIARGDFDEAVKWLSPSESSVAAQPGLLRYDPQLDPIRLDPRFQAFLRKNHLASPVNSQPSDPVSVRKIWGPTIPDPGR